MARMALLRIASGSASCLAGAVAGTFSGVGVGVGAAFASAVSCLGALGADSETGGTAVVGGGTQELRLASAGTGASALKLNASAGGIDIDAADGITLTTTDTDATAGITLTTTDTGIPGRIALVSGVEELQKFYVAHNETKNEIMHRMNQVLFEVFREDFIEHGNFHGFLDFGELTCPVTCIWHFDGAHMEMPWYTIVINQVLSYLCSA